MRLMLNLMYPHWPDTRLMWGLDVATHLVTTNMKLSLSTTLAWRLQLSLQLFVGEVLRWIGIQLLQRRHKTVLYLEAHGTSQLLMTQQVILLMISLISLIWASPKKRG